MINFSCSYLVSVIFPPGLYVLCSAFSSHSRSGIRFLFLTIFLIKPPNLESGVRLALRFWSGQQLACSHQQESVYSLRAGDMRGPRGPCGLLLPVKGRRGGCHVCMTAHYSAWLSSFTITPFRNLTLKHQRLRGSLFF